MVSLSSPVERLVRELGTTASLVWVSLTGTGLFTTTLTTMATTSTDLTPIHRDPEEFSFRPPSLRLPLLRQNPLSTLCTVTPIPSRT